jgi:glucose-6-phosphate 1-epimerase
MASAIRDSQKRFEIPGLAEIVEGNGGLEKVRIISPACHGEMYLHGAHITSWKPAGEEEVLFLSAHSHWEDGLAIRGGIPVCFPWFAHKADDPGAPDHGFVRTKAWELESISRDGDAVIVGMSTKTDEASKKWSPADFRISLHASFGKDLSLELAVSNTGRTPLQFEEALHAYFRLGDIEMTRVRIPDALRYIDKVDSHQIKMQLGDIMFGSETDRVYLQTRDEIAVEDPVLKRHVRIQKENSLTTVAWNPWKEKTSSLTDLGKDEWLRMVCIEPSNVASFAVDLAPGRQHHMKMRIRVVAF